MDTNSLENQEIQNKKWEKALAYWFKMDRHTNLDWVTAAPESGMKEDKQLGEILSKSFNPPRSVIVFVWKENSVIRFTGKEFYLELTIKNDVLATGDKVATIKEFYSASITLLRNKQKVQKTAQADLWELQDMISA